MTSVKNLPTPMSNGYTGNLRLNLAGFRYDLFLASRIFAEELCENPQLRSTTMILNLVGPAKHALRASDRRDRWTSSSVHLTVSSNRKSVTAPDASFISKPLSRPSSISRSMRRTPVTL
jgi:hypothetical protein